MIKVRDLYHSYNRDGKYAVHGVSFEIAKGEVFGFLGPSGAGKSTTQNIITGLLPLQKGAVEVAGYDIAKPHLPMYNRIGVSFEIANLYSKMTALENLRFYAGLFDAPTRNPMELLALVGLEGAAKKKAGAFSKGMKQRLNFARSMLNNPELWFLDEPTSGLDPAIAEEIKEIIKDQNQKGVTVFLTTHNMFIADDLCDRVAFIVDGEIKLIDSPKELKLRFGQHFVDVEYVKDGQIAAGSLSTEDGKDRAELAHIIASFPIRTMHTREATLEQIFIQVTGKGLISDEAV
ncbi:MAG: ABC transporter ATP-binding protein [Candidatus Limiplasma sp.]|nr:ABC transporter ATP-binding protein [Candidatus Limiplasma sp.]